MTSILPPSWNPPVPTEAEKAEVRAGRKLVDAWRGGVTDLHLYYGGRDKASAELDLTKTPLLPGDELVIPDFTFEAGLQAHPDVSGDIRELTDAQARAMTEILGDGVTQLGLIYGSTGEFVELKVAAPQPLMPGAIWTVPEPFDVVDEQCKSGDDPE